ncbi:hypothetical protein EfaCPT1_gp25 [Enterococcus phage EfaCPT1]|uniref:Uncharacterized protein n=1 Tax=Enterococcus phage EfaCPT1 TaxID=1204540 RepID=I7B7C8_9CAUD|nr:hypothetical protein EfaCPT1_gp25 [Enterococcus phage EfaCPT1]AFO10822.1 hypothetical protein EfaCPT1_gp25 [Enterococcus phage EfaCPT1]
MGLFDWKLHDLNGKRDVELVVGVTSFSQHVWIDGVGYQFYDFNMVSNDDETIIKGSVYEGSGLKPVNVFLNCKKKYILFGK